ncbi:permease-like cell division protein FtsX [Massilibacterium senegalense]|uniref:permease-like cell division protein FtsX n=1 Tax=Massilibacterium senegalense TaxID=1632858 RepID=UPI000780646E|nr:permease-like cell division protein FtsX [Massilibacterium senegalense]
MKAETLKRHIREGVKSIGRNGWMTFASVSAVTVTLLIVGFFLLVLANFNHMASKIESDVEMSVFLKKDTSEEQRKALEQKIKQIPEVGEVKYETKEQQLDRLITDFGEDSKTFESLRSENPLLDAYLIKAKDPHDTKKIATQIEKFPNVDKVNYGAKTVERLFSVLKSLRTFGVILIVGLLLTAMFLISNTIKITIFARRKEIEIMRLVGATNSFIRWPFFVEGLMLGVLGSIIPILVVILGYTAVYDYLNSSVQALLLTMVPVFPLTINISFLLLLLGSLIGIWGSVMSLRKFLKI